jgi:hypothetical protein
MLGIIAAILSGFLSGIFANDIRNWLFGPRLVIDLTEQGSRIVTPFSDGTRGIYLRARVRNTGFLVAKSCRAFLTKIEKENDKGQFVNTIYAESCQLAWASQGDGSRSLDIPSGIEQYIDVVHSNDLHEPMFRVVTMPYLLMYQDVIDSAGTYRLEILVSGDGFTPKRYMILVSHSGKWDEVTVDPARTGIPSAAWTG